MTRTIFFTCLAALILSGCNPAPREEPSRPNILFCIADDASWPHMSAYGCNFVRTPAFDRIAEQGILFTRCYTPNAKCSPSRSCILTGRNSWQLEEAANHVPLFPSRFASFVEVLENAGYFTGFTGKGWAPGDPGTVDGKRRQLIGTPYDARSMDTPAGISGTDYAGNFKDFLSDAPAGKPFFFWYGGREPHRPYEYGIGKKRAGKDPADIELVPGFWPDSDTVRNDMLDYAFEVEYFDSHIRTMLAELEESGRLENTLVVVTSDNGMPFPRIKGQEYELSNHMPLAIMWPEGIREPGRVVTDYVSFIDFAPTFLELAGLNWEETEMSPSPGRSLSGYFSAGDVKLAREFVVFGKERHDVGRPDDHGYPIRGIVKDGYLYVKNYEPDRWPAGNPETGYLNCDGGPTKSQILSLRRHKGQWEYWRWNFGKRPGEELYHVEKDSLCMQNLAYSQAHAEIREDLAQTLTEVLREQDDPRVFGHGEVFEQYPYVADQHDFYSRFMAGEDVPTPWVEESDFEPAPVTGNVDAPVVP